MPVSTLTQHQHGEPDSPESVCGGTLVGGEDDDERASEPARVKRVDLSHSSLQWRLARRARRQPLQLPQCLLTACRRRRCGSAILGKSSDRSAQVLSAASAAGATYLLRCTITRRSREAGGERRRDAERAGKWSFILSLGPPGHPVSYEYGVSGSCSRAISQKSHGRKSQVWSEPSEKRAMSDVRYK